LNGFFYNVANSLSPYSLPEMVAEFKLHPLSSFVHLWLQCKAAMSLNTSLCHVSSLPSITFLLVLSNMSTFNFADAMDQPSSPFSSPTTGRSMRASPNKRTRSAVEESDGDGNSDEAIDPALRNEGPTGPTDLLTAAGSRNLAAFANRYATKQKLSPQQVNEVNTFVTVRGRLLGEFHRHLIEN
jgi:hypothetical protein